MVKETIKDLTGWERVSVQGLLDIFKCKFIDIWTLALNYCRCFDISEKNLYFYDRGLLMKIIPNQEGVAAGFIVSMTYFIPQRFPSLNAADYMRDSYAVMGGDLAHLIGRRTFTDLKNVNIDMTVQQEIVADYCRFNKGAVYLDVLKSMRRVKYLRTDEMYHTGGEISYLDILQHINTSPDAVICDEVNKSIYFIDNTQEKPQLICADYRYYDHYGDIYFITQYYRVDMNMEKIFIPIEEVTLLLDTLQLVTIFGCTRDLNSPTEEVSDFQGTKKCNAYLEELLLKGNVSIYGNRAVRYNLEGGLDTDSEFHIEPLYFDTSTNFILAFNCSYEWIYGADKRRIIYRYLDIYKELDYLNMNAISLHLRKRRFAVTPFNYSVVLLASQDLQVLKAAYYKMQCCDSALVNFMSKDKISMRLVSITTESTLHVTFSLKMGEIDFVSTTVIKDFEQEVYSASYIESIYEGYISSSFVGYLINNYNN